jgi:acyl dehydratase
MAAGCAEVRASGWMTADQDRINEFAERAGNRQWMRVDLQRAKREGPRSRVLFRGVLTGIRSSSRRQRLAGDSG